MVQIVVWPALVPSCIMPMSPTGGLRDNRHSFETDSRMPPIERPAASWTPEIYQVELTPLSVDQFDAFQDWYQADLRFGALPFVWLHPITGAEGVWKIVKADPPYQVRKLGRIPGGSTTRRIALSFSVMSQPLAVPVSGSS